MEVFCISNLVNSVMEADEEFIVLDVHFAVTGGSMEAMFEMLHEFLTAPRCGRLVILASEAACCGAPPPRLA